MTDLDRITTEYDRVEDRLRLTGESAGKATVIWLTQRLLNRLLPVLLTWLERQGGGIPRLDLLLGFAQQAAVAEMVPQPPVTAGSECPAWLALAVDVEQGATRVRLRFRGEEGHETATLTLDDKQLRQWLAILQDAWGKAGWPLDPWPEWIGQRSAAVARQEVIVH